MDNELGGNDIINAGGGSDQVFGGAGEDIIDAGEGDDLVAGDGVEFVKIYIAAGTDQASGDRVVIDGG